MAAWLAGTIVENRHWTPALFSLRVSGPPLGFIAGQFVRIALDLAPQAPSPPAELKVELHGGMLCLEYREPD